MTHLSPIGLWGRICALLLLTVLPAVGLLLYSAAEQRETAKKNVTDDAVQFLTIAGTQHSDLIDGVQRTLAAFARYGAEEQGTPEQCSRRFALILPGLRYYLNLGVAGHDGTIICGAIRADPPTNVAERPYFQQAIRTGEFTVSEFMMSRALNRPVMVAALPVKDAGGAVSAVFTAAIDLSWPEHLARTKLLSEGSVFSVIDANGTVLARHPDPGPWVGKPAPEIGMARAALADRYSGTAEVTDPDGREQLYVFARPPGGATTGTIVLSIRVPADVAFAPLDSMLRRNLAVLALVMALTMLLALTAGQLLVMGPIRAIVRAADRLAEGDLEARVEREPGRDELSHITRSFNRMAAALQQRAHERNLLQDKLAESEAHHRAIVEHSTEAIGLISGGVWVFVNRAFVALHGLAGPADIEGQPYDRFVVPEDRPGVRAHVAARLDGSRAETAGQFRIQRPDGAIRMLETSSTLVPYGGQPAVLTTTRDVTERKEEERRLFYLATHDSLTGLVNRYQFLQDLQQQVGLAARRQRQGALLYMDMDHFKEVNDSEGHDAGDAVLREFARVVRGCLRETDPFARIGGDEFTVLLPETDEAGARLAAERVLAAVHGAVVPYNGSSLRMAISIGVALFPLSGEAAEQVVTRADAALRRAKERGRGPVEFYAADASFLSPEQHRQLRNQAT